MVSGILYRAYERRLEVGLRGSALPRHVGVILDGNRRYARQAGLGSFADGHRAGADKVHELVSWCEDLKIPHITVWLLSTDNLRREPDELGDLCGIIAQTVTQLATEGQVTSRRVSAVGALDVLPDELRRALKQAEEDTVDRTGLHVQVAVGYGGRQEITDALRSLLEDRSARGWNLDAVIDDLSTEAISAHLYTNGTPDPDLIIRTSGEIRLGGFLMWQSEHSEFHFTDAYWPAFRRIDFLRALRDFSGRQRRYGR